MWVTAEPWMVRVSRATVDLRAVVFVMKYILALACGVSTEIDCAGVRRVFFSCAQVIHRLPAGRCNAGDNWPASKLAKKAIGRAADELMVHGPRAGSTGRPIDPGARRCRSRDAGQWECNDSERLPLTADNVIEPRGVVGEVQ